MRVLLWVGHEPNQRALAHKIHALFPIAAIVAEKKQGKRKITFGLLFEKIIEKLFLSKISKAWFEMLAFYNYKYPNFPSTELLVVENINSAEAFSFSEKINADIIIVSGTRLIKDKLLSLKPSIGILNLHTGLSPYIKGGPNCTNWCIATKKFHLIGNTIMWIDAGIDTGNLISTALTPVSGNENFSELHIKVMEQGHNLYLNALSNLAQGRKSNVAQNQICEGITYYTKQWTLKQKFLLVKNFSHFKEEVNSDSYKLERQRIKTVDFSEKVVN